MVVDLYHLHITDLSRRRGFSSERDPRFVPLMSPQVARSNLSDMGVPFRWPETPLGNRLLFGCPQSVHMTASFHAIADYRSLSDH